MVILAKHALMDNLFMLVLMFVFLVEYLIVLFAQLMDNVQLVTKVTIPPLLMLLQDSLMLAIYALCPIVQHVHQLLFA